MAVGSIMGGYLIQNGRKRMVILFNIFSIISCILSLIKNTTCICIGRVLFGICSGVFMCATPKILDETIPVHLIEYGYGQSTNICVNVYVMVSLLLSLGMPSEVEDLKTTEFWRVIYGLPILISLVTIALNTWVHTEDSLRFHV